MASDESLSETSTAASFSALPLITQPIKRLLIFGGSLGILRLFEPR
ncbi:hypothetical protein ACH4C6_33780 [Streptomyces sp. NPDC017943]